MDQDDLREEGDLPEPDFTASPATDDDDLDEDTESLDGLSDKELDESEAEDDFEDKEDDEDEDMFDDEDGDGNSDY